MIQRLLQWFRNLTRLEVSAVNSAAQMAQAYGINRRRYTRVLFPESSVSLLPRLGLEAQDLPIVNFSIGGACVEDHFDLILPNLGDIVEIKFDWLQWSLPVKVRIAGASKHVNRHLEFIGLPEELKQDLGLLVQAGSIGQRLTQAPSLESAPVKLGVAELWTSNTGENLRIVDSETEYGSLSTESEDWVFIKSGLPLWRPSGTSQPLREANVISVACLIILLANIESPSLPVRQLRILLSRLPQAFQPTGSDV